MLGSLYYDLLKHERRSKLITDEKFIEVLKSLTKEDFGAVHKIVSELGDKFDNKYLREMFTEDEIKSFSELMEGYSGEIRVAVLVCKFKGEVMFTIDIV